MAYIKVENSFTDYELVNLRGFLELLDSKLASIECEISEASCPDSEGIFDKAEYYVGLGFSAIQKYMTSIYTQSGLSKKNALNQGRRFCEESTVVSIINATANYWKHEDEW